MDLNKDGKLDKEDMEQASTKMMELLQFNMPAGGGFVAGFVGGVRSGQCYGTACVEYGCVLAPRNMCEQIGQVGIAIHSYHVFDGIGEFMCHGCNG